MGDNSATFHEAVETLQPRTMDRHRAVASLMEELEAVDWYDQRIDATTDSELRDILIHNRDEEKEHAAMVLEWLRRRDPALDGFLRQYLFTEGSITAIEDDDESSSGNASGAAASNGNGGTLGIGSLRGEEQPMTHLHRELAPISDDAWAEIDKEAARTLRTFLAGRQLIDFAGPHGWDYSAESLGCLERVLGPVDGVEAGVRVVQPLVELRHSFSMPRTIIDEISRGRPDPDLAAVVEAAKRAALAEDHIVFNGFKEAHITGMAEASPYPGIEIDDNYAEYPKLVARAVGMLREAGIDGPYAAALGPRCWTGVIETTEHGGYPVLEHLRLILGGPVIWAPAVDGAVVLSTRGEDFQLTCGQDLALGFLSYDAETVRLFLEESIGFRVLTPEAAVSLVHLG